jgi:hypothetical protein
MPGLRAEEEWARSKSAGSARHGACDKAHLPDLQKQLTQLLEAEKAAVRHTQLSGKGQEKLSGLQLKIGTVREAIAEQQAGAKQVEAVPSQVWI